VKNIIGFKRSLVIFKIKLWVLFSYLPEIFKGKISIGRYLSFLRRMLYFLSRLDHNKFFRIDKTLRLGLYIPRFPSRAFFTACSKFMTFDEKLPCTTVLISVTSACRFNCQHCYQKKDVGKDIDIEVMINVTKKLQASGVSFFNIEGGEPFLVYDRLKKLCAAIDQGAEIWINSTGDGMTLKRLKELKTLGLTSIMFSLHSANSSKVNAFMQSPKAWDILTEGIRLCHQADILVSFNSCLNRESFYNGDFQALMNKTKEFHAGLIQIIKPKPSGGWLESGVEDFSKGDLEQVKQLVCQYNHDRRYKDYPSISAQILEEDPSVFGCTAGGTERFYLNAKGDVQPCEFLNISFGNIGQEDFTGIYKRMRDCFKIPGECWLCEKYSSNILKIMQEKSLKILPLDKKLSEAVYSHWDRGKATEIYKKIENDLTSDCN